MNEISESTKRSNNQIWSRILVIGFTPTRLVLSHSPCLWAVAASPQSIVWPLNLLMCYTYTHTQPLYGPLGFTGARDSEWQRHKLGHMQIYTLTQTHNHASITPLSFLQDRCPSCCPTSSVKVLKAPAYVLWK